MKRNTSEVEFLRRELAGRRSRRGRMVEALRVRGCAYVRKRADGGARVADLAAELGIAERTVKRWLATTRAPTTERITGLLPVRVVDIDARPSHVGAVVTTPSGLRIEGLDIDAVCAVIVRCG
jgi:hypothetical protein